MSATFWAFMSGTVAGSGSMLFLCVKLWGRMVPSEHHEKVKRDWEAEMRELEQKTEELCGCPRCNRTSKQGLQ